MEVSGAVVVAQSFTLGRTLAKNRIINTLTRLNRYAASFIVATVWMNYIRQRGYSGHYKWVRSEAPAAAEASPPLSVLSARGTVGTGCYLRAQNIKVSNGIPDLLLS